MSKNLTALEVWMNKQLTDIVKSGVATFSQTKLGTDSGRAAWADVEKCMVRTAIRLNRRGNTGFRGDISSAGQVP